MPGEAAAKGADQLRTPRRFARLQLLDTRCNPPASGPLLAGVAGQGRSGRQDVVKVDGCLVSVQGKPRIGLKRVNALESRRLEWKGLERAGLVRQAGQGSMARSGARRLAKNVSFACTEMASNGCAVLGTSRVASA